MIKKCNSCAYFQNQKNKNTICSLKKLKNPTSPGLYIINPNELACNTYVEKNVTDK